MGPPGLIPAVRLAVPADLPVDGLEAFADAGADVLFAPGLKTKDEIAAVVKAIAPKPLNVLMGFATGNLSVKELEDISHYSYRNIQRIFKYSCGETIGAFQQRLKVENAYKRILYTQENLTSIAIEVGFDAVNPISTKKLISFYRN